MNGKAEVYYKNNYGHHEVAILGEDNLLYDYNNVWHHSEPYSQELRKKLPFNQEEVERILSKGVIFHKNGTIEDRLNGQDKNSA